MTDDNVEQTISSAKTKKSFTISLKEVIGIIVVIVLILLSFFLGAAYGRRHHPNNSTVATSSHFGNAGGGFQRRGNIDLGNVTAISSSSITIDNSHSNATQTFAITSTTSISDGGQSVASSTITTGERVVIVPSSSNSSDTATIIVNPAFGAGAPPAGSNAGGG